MNPIEINSQQHLEELREKYGEALFTMQKDSVAFIEEFSDAQIDEVLMLLQKLMFIFTIENSTTVNNPSDELLLRFFINMEMAKLFDNPTKRHKTVTLKNFLKIHELNEILLKHKDSIERLTMYRKKVLAHTDLDAVDKVDPKAIIEYIGMLREIADVLFKVIYVYCKQSQKRLCENIVFGELLHRNAELTSFYSDKKMLGKQVVLEGTTTV